jgi:general secretion pathway protein J
VTRRSQRGFTLLEIMISIAILAAMMSMAWFTIATTASSKELVEKNEERYEEIRVALARMVKDIESAYISANENQNLPERRTMMIGEDHGSVGELRFSSMGHTVLWANANESEQTLIAYYPESDREDRGKTNLLRRESRRLSNEPWKSEKGDVDVLLRDVDKVKFEYYDARDNEWKSSWDTTKADAQRSRMPQRVRITVEIQPEKGERQIYTTEARVMLQEELKFFTN